MPARIFLIALENASELVRTDVRMRSTSAGDFTMRAFSMTGPMGFNPEASGSSSLSVSQASYDSRDISNPMRFRPFRLIAWAARRISGQIGEHTSELQSHSFI